jgi:membrane protein implicated in regulation of membrane protease activity
VCTTAIKVPYASRRDGEGSVAAHWLWWILAVVLIGVELVSGTFYLLAVAVALAIGGVAAWLGASPPVQLLIAAALALVGVVAHRWRVRRGARPTQVPLDVGQPVQVQLWHPDGTARVTYRGTQWDAELLQPGAARQHTMYIVGTRGSTLLLDAERPA